MFFCTQKERNVYSSYHFKYKPSRVWKGYNLEYIYLCLWSAICVCVCVCTFWTYNICICACVCVCVHVSPSSVPIRWEWRSVPLGCLTDISCPFFFRKWMQPITIRGFINSLWASWSYRGWWIQSVRWPMPNIPLPTPPSPTIVEIKRWRKSLSLFVSLRPFSLFVFSLCHSPVSFFFLSFSLFSSPILFLLMSSPYNVKTVSI